jgi:hypothetical protein
MSLIRPLILSRQEGPEIDQQPCEPLYICHVFLKNIIIIITIQRIVEKCIFIEYREIHLKLATLGSYPCTTTKTKARNMHGSTARTLSNSWLVCI